MAYELARGLLAARCVRLPGAIRAVNDLGLQAPRPLGVTADVSDGTERPHPLYCRAASEVDQPSNAGIVGHQPVFSWALACSPSGCAQHLRRGQGRNVW